jgi:hypothetical protein
MPAPIQTFFDGKYIYSVDMMLAYINTIGHPVEKIPTTELVPQLELEVWGDWSPMTVINNMDKKKYAKNAERIEKANMTYPIIIAGGRIVDGYHRAAKAYLKGTKQMKAYVFDAALMRKFILNKDMNFVKVHQHTSIRDILELWTKRFCK